jgi:hypothetical protein
MAAEPKIDFGDIEYWDELIDADIALAQTLLRVKKYFNSGFTCYKASLKILSRWFVGGGHQPYELPAVESLIEFARAISIYGELPPEKIQLLVALDAFNAASNSAVQKDEFSSTLAEDYCATILTQTEELYELIKAYKENA